MDIMRLHARYLPTIPLYFNTYVIKFVNDETYECRRKCNLNSQESK